MTNYADVGIMLFMTFIGMAIFLATLEIFIKTKSSMITKNTQIYGQ